MVRQGARDRRRHAANTQLNDCAVGHQARDVAAHAQLSLVRRPGGQFGQRCVAGGGDDDSTSVQAESRAGMRHPGVDLDQHHARGLRSNPHIVDRTTETVITLRIRGRHLQQHDIGLEQTGLEVRGQLRHLGRNHARGAACDDMADRPQATIGRDRERRVERRAPGRVERVAAEYVDLADRRGNIEQLTNQPHGFAGRLAHDHVIAAAHVLS